MKLNPCISEELKNKIIDMEKNCFFSLDATKNRMHLLFSLFSEL